MNPRSILLAGSPVYIEGKTASAIVPGKLITQVGGPATMLQSSVIALASAGAITTAFARENETIGGGIDTPYAAGSNVLGFIAQRGDIVYAWLAAGQNVVAGALLSAGAAGNLVAATPGSTTGDPVTAVTFPSFVVAKATEAVNNSGGSNPVRIKVEIL